MDAYDLFKQLSVGAKFNTKKFGKDEKRFHVKREKESLDNVKIKIEKSKDCQVPAQKRKAEEDSNEENEENRQDTTLTLLGGITVPSDGTKIKKKKIKIMTEDKILQLEQEKTNEMRNKNRISVVGRRAPRPIESFHELSEDYNVASDLVDNIFKCGYTKPTSIQMQAIPLMLKNRQILACAPTGSGKTAAFLIPIIHHLKEPRKCGFRAVILSPTRELAKQTFSECSRLSEGRGFRIHIISKIKQAMTQYGPKSSQKFDILITTPKRLLFLLNQDPPAICLGNVEWLVIDEADKLFEDGTRSFRDQLDEITRACTNEKLCSAMFSATNTTVVTTWCRHNLKGLVNVTIGERNAAAVDVEQKLLFVGSERGKLVAFRNIVNEGMAPPVLVFVQSKERAQELFNELIYDGINVDVIHADRTQTQRDNVVRCFREGKIWVLICTELMSRGIDFKGVNLVVNYDFPPSAISYVHRIGRTGRAGHKGQAITFFTEQDTINLRSIAAIVKASGCPVPDYMLAMKKHCKRDRKKMEREQPKRQSISTIPKFKKPRKTKSKIITTDDNKKVGEKKNKLGNDKNKKKQLTKKPTGKSMKKSTKTRKVDNPGKIKSKKKKETL